MHEDIGAGMNAAMHSAHSTNSLIQPLLKKARIGFVGTGWIGKNRMSALLAQPSCEAVAIVEPDRESAKAARALTNYSATICSFEELLKSEVDGIVIATPSAMHAQQAVAALERGIPVFCQKPLARNFRETQMVVETARRVNRLLSVDFSYRFVRGVEQIRSLVSDGSLGEIYAIQLTFHNAYGPGKTWFFEREQSGGGCLMDLGIHLVDLALWLLDFPGLSNIHSHLFSGGKPLSTRNGFVEDYANAALCFDTGAIANLACSWRAHAGRDAVIEVTCLGTKGGASLQNVNGSFFDFVTERYSGTRTEVLSQPPDDWGGRAIVEWFNRLCVSKSFDSEAEQYAEVASVLDQVYAACAS
jgi:predicted dehydrogenase